jgi:hypothetical protein
VGEPREVTVVGGGFTAGFAAVLRTSSDRVFVKAAPAGSDIGGWYAREAEIVRALPPAAPTPRLRWADELAGHVGALLRRGGRADAGAGLVGAGPRRGAGGPRRGRPGVGRSAARAGGTGAGDVAGGRPVRRLATPARRESELPAFATRLAPRLEELAAWEARIAELCAGTTAMMHCDVRLDNVLIDGDGVAWICDWNFVCRGPAWLDAVALLLSAIPGGHDVDALFHGLACVKGAPPTRSTWDWPR